MERRKRSKDALPAGRAGGAVRPGVGSRRARWSTATRFAIPALLAAVAALIVLGRLSPWVLGLYGLLSTVTFIVYAVDKSAAARGGWRTPENTLHLLAIAGGWPGALLAQQLLRHKSTKQPFRQVFWATVVLNVVGLVLLATGAPGRPGLPA